MQSILAEYVLISADARAIPQALRVLCQLRIAPISEGPQRPPLREEDGQAEDGGMECEITKH